MALVGAVTAGCGGRPSAHRLLESTPPPPISTECGGLQGARAHPRWLHTSDGQLLYAITAGSGPTGVVLVPESPPGSVCGWLPYMATLEH